MFKNLLTIVAILVTSSFAIGQVTILDFETPETSSTFQYFGISEEGILNNIIANPAPDGVNGSATVADFVKEANAMPWMGAFNTEMIASIDVTNMAEVCVKVHMPVISSLSLKLEGEGVDPWITTQPNTVMNAWEEICFDLTDPSIEDPFTPGFGNVFATAVLFFEFQTVLDADRTYYFDDLVVRQGNAASEGDVTFSVDMSDYADPFTSVSVFGTFNSFDPTANPLTDNGDGTWSTTVADIPVGAHEYLFIVDNVTAESMSSTDVCTITDDSGMFTNRQLVIAGDVALETVCFNSCYACGESVEITMNVGTSHINVDANGIFLSGGGNFGVPGDFPMTDDDGDGVYTISVERPLGFQSFYAFANGACPDFSCKENLDGQDCAFGQFNDRMFGPLMADTTINTCYALCTTDTDCSGAGAPGDITFQLDMNGYPNPFTTAYIFGGFNGFDPTANPMSDDDGDGIWETTISLVAGPTQYKFLADGTEEIFMEGDPCTITSPDGIFTNRLIEVEGDETVCFPFESCDMCTVGTNDLTVEENLFTIAPTLTADNSIITFNTDFTGEKSIRVFNVMGEMVYTNELAPTADAHQIEVITFAKGIYMVHVQVGNVIATKKIMKF